MRGALTGQPAGVPRYPDDLEAVLLTTSDVDRAVITARLDEREREAGRVDDLSEALSRVRYSPDLLTTTLRFDDYMDAAPADASFVTQALAVTVDTDDATPIRDFTTQINGHQLEARDSHVRRQTTNFGGFVAECVRLHAGADVAIVNSGSFRCDSELDPKLRVRDLREAFLYDKDGAVIVLELDSATVGALLAHGESRSGSGAYPQVSDQRSVPTERTKTIKVAISSYLLTQEDSMDGYDEVLMRKRGLNDVQQARDWAAEEAKRYRAFGIIEAVKTQASKASFGNPQTSLDEQSTLLVELLKGYADAFFNEVRKDDAPLGKVFPTESERSRVFRQWLGNDIKVTASPSIEAARDKVRAFLHALPAVATYSKKGGANSIEMWSAAEKELLALQAKMAGHDFVFRDRADYAWLFDLAARGLPGWRSRAG